MTQDQDLLRPLEPAQCLAPANRVTLDAIQTALGECTTLITTQGAALQQTADRHLEALQACADAVGRLAERIDAAHNHEAARQAELTETLQQVPAALTGFTRSLDETRKESTNGMHADLSALNDTLETIAGTFGSHDRRLASVTETMSVLSAAVATLRAETRGRWDREAHPGQTRVLNNVVRGTAMLAARFGFFEATLERYKTDFWLHAVAIPLLIGCAFFFGMMTDLMIRFLDAPAATSALPELPLPPLPTDTSLE
ncbi:MAG: hypothetical protein J4G15_13325 [Alphaproteobacteria bacterium]|nr:hypothetical protein [Alphaproteobacteria bacterium]